VLFPTVEFAVFFVVVFVVSWLLRPHPAAWKAFILLASYLFYGWWEARFVLLLAASSVVNWVLGGLVYAAATEEGRKRWLGVAVVANLAVLGWFKYYGFFVESVVGSFGRLGLDVNPPLVRVILPVGISFFTFHAMSYVIDLYRGDTRPAGLVDFSVYMAFFPHLVAGPIVRASELVPQIEVRPDPRRVDSALAFRLIFAGLFKKVVVSSFVATAIVDDVFAVPQAHSSLEILFAVYAYAVQIYADFSGYTDIAIGVALLLGFRFPQNFDAPYSALSIQDFWRRWHITLSRWLRDYLYIPLGGNRGSPSRVHRNLMLTMLLGGLWHGAAWTFVVWGGIHGLAQVGERVWADRRAERGLPAGPLSPLGAVGRWLLTFHVVCLAWVFFRAETFADARELLTRLLTAWGPAPLVTPLLVVTIVAMLASQFVPSEAVGRVQAGFSRLGPVAQGAALAAGLVLVGALGPEGVAPFIYFQF
jgi:D-alanyl-lipoteichoic acid acyltransferase DltB (MBOAT superfamily)